MLLTSEIGNGDARAVDAEGEAAAIQVEIDRELRDGFARFEVPGSDGSVGPEGYERTVGRTLDPIDRGIGDCRSAPESVFPFPSRRR